MFELLKLSHHKHTGRIREHEHTSYVPLCFLLILVGLALCSYTANAWERPGPGADSISLTGTMPATPPTEAAEITLPIDQTRFSATPIDVSGTCPESTLVELFKNDIFAGSTVCSDSGTFSLQIDLLVGENALVAKVYDSLNQAGPDSNIVTVYYDALPIQTDPIAGIDFDGQQLVINTDAAFRGSFPEEEIRIPITIIGGTPPYAVNIKWGDSNNDVVSRNDNSTFTQTHSYRKAGVYQMTIQVSDTNNRVAFLSVAIIVNGQPGVAASTTTTADTVTLNSLLAMWPLFVGIVAIVISFWIGEKREKAILAKHGRLLPS